MRPRLFVCLTTVFLCTLVRGKICTAEAAVEWNTGHEVNIDLAVSSDFKLLATIGVKNHLRIWALADGKLLSNLSMPDTVPYRAVFAPSGRQLAVSILSHAGAKILFVDVHSAKVSKEVSLGVSLATSITYSSDGTRLYAGCSSDKEPNSNIEIEVHSGKVRELSKETDIRHGTELTLQQIDLTPNNDLLFSSENGGNLMVWSVLDDRTLTSLKLSTEALEYISCSPDGKRLAIATEDSRKVSIYDIATLKNSKAAIATPSKDIYAAAGRINSISWSSDGGAIALATAVPEHQLELFSTTTGLRVSAPLPFDLKDPVFRAIPILNDKKIAILTKHKVAILDLNHEGLNESYRKMIKVDTRAAQIAKQVYDSGTSEIQVQLPTKYADEVLYFLSTKQNVSRVTLVGSGIVGHRESTHLDGLSYLAAGTQLEDITLCNVRLRNLESLSSIQQLKHLTLNGVSEVDDWSSIEDLSNLVELDLAEAAVENRAIEKISSLTSLKKLRLHSSQYIEGRFVSLFSDEGAQFLERLVSLEQLELRCWDVNFESGKIIRNMKKLKHLDISGTDIHDGCAEYLPNLLSLETAKLGHLTSVTLHQIAELPSLTTVSFDGTRINSIDLALLLNSKSLTNISVSNFWLPEPISDFMRRLPKMSADELLAYDLIRLLQKTRTAMKKSQSSKEYMMALGVRAPKLGSDGLQNRFSTADPGHPRCADYLQRVREYSATFSLLNDATISLTRKESAVTHAARTISKLAFSDQPQRLRQMEEVIDSLERY